MFDKAAKISIKHKNLFYKFDHTEGSNYFSGHFNNDGTKFGFGIQFWHDGNI